MTVQSAPLVVHVIYRLSTGGMENGLVNLINQMPADRYRHAIICIDKYTDYIRRIRREDVEVFALNKRAGLDIFALLRFWKLLRRLRPRIVHTRNLGALEFQLPALLAGVKVRVQGEHGRDTSDLHGTNKKYLRFRKLLDPVVCQYIALSVNLAEWLKTRVGVSSAKIRQIYNGVDCNRFKIAEDNSFFRRSILPFGFAPDDAVIIGTIGRLQKEKDQLTLVRAFLNLKDMLYHGQDKIRLVLVGDGPLLKPIEQLLKENGAESMVWLAGTRDDVPEIMQALDIFVLPSLIEGVSNTILEAMATGLPVVATNVGGNPELVLDGETGFLVPAADPLSMAKAIHTYCMSGEDRRAHGCAGRRRVQKVFSLQNMVNGYLEVYDELLGSAPAAISDMREQ